MSAKVPPARPHTAVTEDGRRVREVVSYARRSSRMSQRQEQAWSRRHGQWWIPDELLDSAGFDLVGCFGRQAPLIVEIGSGIGEATAALAAARPSYNVLAFEVWRPGIAETFLRLEAAGAHNVRLSSVDAAWSLEHLLAPESVAELWTFFPDPWPKRRHRDRRLVRPGFARAAASRLQEGARWRLATDWPDYADQMRAVLDAEPLLVSAGEPPAQRWSERPVTRFERRGLREGRPVMDLTYLRRAAEAGG